MKAKEMAEELVRLFDCDELLCKACVDKYHKRSTRFAIDISRAFLELEAKYQALEKAARAAIESHIDDSNSWRHNLETQLTPDGARND